MTELGIIEIKYLPLWWQMKIGKYCCPYCGENKLLKRRHEEVGKYLECRECRRAYQ